MRKAGLPRELVHFVRAENFFGLVRLYRLICSSTDPRANDVRVAALLKASEQLLERIRLNMGLIGWCSGLSIPWCKQCAKRVGQAGASCAPNLRDILVAERGVDRIIQKAHPRDACANALGLEHLDF
jgi:hypothetical protein